jgi:hypothetical protein
MQAIGSPPGFALLETPVARADLVRHDGHGQ